jgi:hypothetical protein
MNKRMFSFLIIFFFAGQLVISQNLISGNVSRENKKPLPGAKVTIEGVLNVEETTDQSGNFDIDVPLTAKTLVFSYEGMQTQKVSIGKKSFIAVIMLALVNEPTKTTVKKDEKPKTDNNNNVNQGEKPKENVKKDTKETPKGSSTNKVQPVNKSTKPVDKSVKQEPKTKDNSKSNEKPKPTKDNNSVTDTSKLQKSTPTKPSKTTKVQTEKKSK